MDSYEDLQETVEDALNVLLEAVIEAKDQPGRVRALEATDALLRKARRTLEGMG